MAYHPSWEMWKVGYSHDTPPLLSTSPTFGHSSCFLAIPPSFRVVQGLAQHTRILTGFVSRRGVSSEGPLALSFGRPQPVHSQGRTPQGAPPQPSTFCLSFVCLSISNLSCSLEENQYADSAPIPPLTNPVSLAPASLTNQKNTAYITTNPHKVNASFFFVVFFTTPIPCSQLTAWFILPTFRLTQIPHVFARGGPAHATIATDQPASLVQGIAQTHQTPYGLRPIDNTGNRSSFTFPGVLCQYLFLLALPSDSPGDQI